MSTEKPESLLDDLGGDNFKPVAMSAIRGWYGGDWLLTRDPQRIRDIAGRVSLPKDAWDSAEFPEEIERLTIWTDDHVISVHENHEGGTSVLQLPRNPPAKPDYEWDGRS